MSKQEEPYVCAMPPLSAELSLTPVQYHDQAELYTLMQRIYPPVYAHMWPDGGKWYLESQYNERQLARELGEEGAEYHFVCLHDRAVGMLRLIDDRPLSDRPGPRGSKLHRLYLDPAIHGRGVGRGVVEWAIRTRTATGFDLLWLEAMDTAAAALAFYRRMGFAITAPFVLDMPLMYPGCRGMYRMAIELNYTCIVPQR
jgi:ribosomal protein S18 acetylase RimI-like enzyme